MIVSDEEVYDLDDLVVYELPQKASEPVKGMYEWSIHARARASPSMTDAYGNPGILSQNEGLGLTMKLSVNPSTSTS